MEEKYLDIANKILNLVDRYSDLDAVIEQESDDFANGYVELQYGIANIIKNDLK